MQLVVVLLCCITIINHVCVGDMTMMATTTTATRGGEGSYSPASAPGIPLVDGAGNIYGKAGPAEDLPYHTKMSTRPLNVDSRPGYQNAPAPVGILLYYHTKWPTARVVYKDYGAGPDLSVPMQPSLSFQFNPTRGWKQVWLPTETATKIRFIHDKLMDRGTRSINDGYTIMRPGIYSIDAIRHTAAMPVNQYGGRVVPRPTTWQNNYDYPGRPRTLRTLSPVVRGPIDPRPQWRDINDLEQIRHAF